MTLRIRDNGSWYVDITVENALSDLITHHFLYELEHEFGEQVVHTALLWIDAQNKENRGEGDSQMKVSDEIKTVARCIRVAIRTDISDGYREY